MAVNLVLFAGTDRVLFGTTPTFYALLALRATGVVVTTTVLVAASRCRMPGRMDALHLALAVLYAVTVVVLDATRPRSFILFIVIGVEAGLLFAWWTFFTARFAYQAIAAAPGQGQGLHHVSEHVAQVHGGRGGRSAPRLNAGSGAEPSFAFCGTSSSAFFPLSNRLGAARCRRTEGRTQVPPPT